MIPRQTYHLTPRTGPAPYVCPFSRGLAEVKTTPVIDRLRRDSLRAAFGAQELASVRISRMKMG